tara:strand:+ start:192 stop:308 length:117 start_codon:yes stop_codon:yes gene_type:complete
MGMFFSKLLQLQLVLANALVSKEELLTPVQHRATHLLP